ncbi:MAG: hypothetical protein JO352_28760 [Chloroflexi bacterium]|nr:hypothetical protein [Chloroflexota bacterium]
MAVDPERQRHLPGCLNLIPERAVVEFAVQQDVLDRPAREVARFGQVCFAIGRRGASRQHLRAVEHHGVRARDPRLVARRHGGVASQIQAARHMRARAPYIVSNQLRGRRAELESLLVRGPVQVEMQR